MFNDFVTLTLPTTSNSVRRVKPASLLNGSGGYTHAKINSLFSNWESILDTPTAPADMSSLNDNINDMSLCGPLSPFPTAPSQQFDTGIPNYLEDMQQGPFAFEGYPNVFPALTGPEIAPPASFVPLDLDYLNQLFQYEPACSQIQTAPLTSLLPSESHESSKPGFSADPNVTTAIITPSSAWLQGFPFIPTPQSSPDASREKLPEIKVKAEDNEGDEVSSSPPLSRSRLSSNKTISTRARSTRFDPLNSSGKHKCCHDGCTWRFPSRRMLLRHERTHENGGANEYFCPNSTCPTNSLAVGKRWTGFSRGDALRRHLKQKSPDDPCVVMAREKGWSVLSGAKEEEIFRAPSRSTL